MKSFLKSKKGFLSILERMASASLNITASVFLRTMLSVRPNEPGVSERVELRPLMVNSKQILELDKNYCITYADCILSSKIWLIELNHMRAPFDNLSCT